MFINRHVFFFFRISHLEHCRRSSPICDSMCAMPPCVGVIHEGANVSAAHCECIVACRTQAKDECKNNKNVIHSWAALALGTATPITIRTATTYPLFSNSFVSSIQMFLTLFSFISHSPIFCSSTFSRQRSSDASDSMTSPFYHDFSFFGCNEFFSFLRFVETKMWRLFRNIDILWSVQYLRLQRNPKRQRDREQGISIWIATRHKSVATMWQWK